MSFSSLKSQGCKNIRHSIRFMSFAIPRRTSPPPPYDNWVSNALNLNIFAITDDKHVRRPSTKFLISMVISNFNVLRLRCFYWMCLMKIAIALKKRSQIGTNKCKGHFTNISWKANNQREQDSQPENNLSCREEWTALPPLYLKIIGWADK